MTLRVVESVITFTQLSLETLRFLMRFLGLLPDLFTLKVDMLCD